MFQAHAAQDNHVDFGLQGNACQQRVIGLASGGEDGEFLRFNQRVEDIDHGNPGTHHVSRDNPFGGIDGRPTDLDQIVTQCRALVTRLRTPIEDASEQVFRKGHAHGLTKEPYSGIRGHAACSREYLQGDFVVLEADHLGQRGAKTRGDLGQFPVFDAGRPDIDHASGNVFNLVIDFLHV